MTVKYTSAGSEVRGGEIIPTWDLVTI